MNLQLAIVIVLVALAALYFGWGFVLGLLGRGGCSSDGACNKCGSGGCTLSKLEAFQKEWIIRKSKES